MQPLLFFAAISAAVLCFEKPAEAQNYPWCAYYAVGDEARNCGFVSYEQCMANVTGIGGYCARNTQYVPSVAAWDGI